MQHPTLRRACGRCGLPAVYRVALVGLDQDPTEMLARRSHYRCPDCFRDVVAPSALLTAAHDRQRLVVDAVFTASLFAVAS